MEKKQNENTIDKIELTKTEFDELAIRESRIQEKLNQMNFLNADLQIHKNETATFIDKLLVRRGLEGAWKKEGNFLIKIKETSSASS